MDVIQLLTAFGVGSIVTTLIHAWLNHVSDKRKLTFNEKKEAYSGFWNAHLTGYPDNEDHIREFVLWHMRCDMVAPPSVRKAIQNVIDNNKASKEDKQKATDILREEIRKDLGIQKC